MSQADISSMLRGMGEFRRRAEAAALRGLDLAGEHVLTAAKVLCPKETGTLAASGTTLPATSEDGRLEKVIGFNTQYAAAVHERLNARHAAPTQAKFLESAMRSRAQRVAEFVAREIRREAQ